MSDQEAIGGPKDQNPDTSFEYPVINIALFEMAVNVLRSLLSEVGANRALEAIKSYSQVWGINAANMAKQRFGLKGSELEDVALPYYLYHCASSFGHIKPMEIRNGNAVVELYACPSKQIPDCPPEICIALSHYISEGICQATNPEYEIIFTHHIANHDDRCRYIVKKKSSNVDLDDLGGLQKTIPLDLSQEEMFMLGGFVSYSMVNMFTSASIDLIGTERTLELTLPMTRMTGNKVGKSLIDDSKGNGNIQTISEKIEFFNSFIGRIGAPIKLNGSVLEKEIVECPCKGSPNEVCKQFEALSIGICEAINPEYEFAYDRMMSKGDGSCHWVVSKKTEPSKQQPREEVTPEDPTKNLALRLSKGEISLEEFEKNIASLRKHGIVD
jgi:hypothetical protein